MFAPAIPVILVWTLVAARFAVLVPILVVASWGAAIALAVDMAA